MTKATLDFLAFLTASGIIIIILIFLTILMEVLG